MKIIRSVEEYLRLRNIINQDSSGFVPTMGALHTGHESLIKMSLDANACTIASIYVNPTQFNKPCDLENYPDSLTQDIEVLESLACDYLFLPSYKEMYPDNFRYKIEENELSRDLCGSHREGHFTGVLSIVMKLLNIVKPNTAYFGEKDYQQFLLIKGMAEAFFLDTRIVSCPTIRETDGLALSSRNLNLDNESRKIAPLVYQLLTSDKSDDQIKALLNDTGFEVDYITSHNGRRYAAASLGAKGKEEGKEKRKVRLIDNVALNQ